MSHPQDAVVDLELDELNQHECMAALTGLIGHMHRNNITPKTHQVTLHLCLGQKRPFATCDQMQYSFFLTFFFFNKTGKRTQRTSTMD